MERIAIDLLWVRPGQVGGTEVYVRNLLDGFMELQEDFRFVLFVSEDNADTFRHYTNDSRFEILMANTVSANIGGRIIWQYLHQNRFLKKNGIKHCFVPVYCRPFFNGGIHYINVMHDIQAYHFPQYHPFHENIYSYVTWFAVRLFTRDIITTSEFVKEDIVNNFGFTRDRISVIPIPVCIDEDNITDFAEISERYGIEKGEYYYSVSQNIPHKNLVTLIKVMARIKKDNIKLPTKLVVSGISGNASDEVEHLINELNVKENIIQTGYIIDSDRNCLYMNARAFLFPSYFEGFGIPPVEAMLFGQHVITTRATSIPEVTKGMADYVEDYKNPDEWIKVMENNTSNDIDVIKAEFDHYKRNKVAGEYVNYLARVIEVSGECK